MYSYTFYCTFFICCVQVFSMEIPDVIFDKPALECMEKTNIDKSFVKKHLNAKFYVVNADSKVFEFLECLGKSKGFIKEDGKLNSTSIHESIISIMIPVLNKSGDKHEMANKVIDECIDTSGDSYGERICNVHNCFVDAFAKY